MSIALQDLLIADRPGVPLLAPGPRRMESGGESPTPSETMARELYFRVSATDLLLCTDELNGFDLTSYQFQRKYQQGGDKLYCDNIDGGAAWGVRLGPSQNPIIPLYPGRTINKRFRYFTLYQTQPAPSFSSPGGNGDLQETRIDLYVSTGEQLIVDSPRGNVGRGFGSRTVGRTDCVATTAPRLILADFNNPGGFPNNVNITQWKPGRNGATLILRNTDLVGELFIAQQSSQTLSPVLTTEMFRLYGGETLTLDLDGSIQQAFNQFRLIGTPDVGFVVYTKGGTINYDWMLSRLDCDPAPSGRPLDNLGVNLG